METKIWKNGVLMNDSEFSKFGVLWSVRRRAKEMTDLLNAVSAKFGREIVRHPYCYGDFINCSPSAPIYFKEHGNKYSYRFEFFCVDVDVLEEIKVVFPKFFIGEVCIKEGMC